MPNISPAPTSAPQAGWPTHATGTALVDLLGEVAAADYAFITPTPLTHQRVLRNRGDGPARSLRDVFGWNLPFDATVVPGAVLTALHAADAVSVSGGFYRSKVRIASLDGHLFIHSAFPTDQEDAVFFGPDTYRFARFIRTTCRHAPVSPDRQALRILDVGCGSGAGGIAAAHALSSQSGVATQVVMNDVNPLALHYARVNVSVAGLGAVFAQGDALSAVEGEFDLIVSNPPYMDDSGNRAYRHGGDGLGRALSIRIAAEALTRLAPGGSLLLYTGVAILGGCDPFLSEMLPLLQTADCDWSYEELDPDVFGEELDQPRYAHAERIAVVGLVATRNLPSL